MGGGQYDRLKEMATDLISRKVAVIASNTPTAPVAKAATAEVPIVFVNTGDPVVAGLVASFNRPGGNVTGVSLLGPELETKRLELLGQLVPGTTPVGVLVNPMNPAADIQLRKLQEAAGVMKRQIDVVRASTPPDIEMAFEIVAQNGADGLLVVQDPFYNSRRDQIVALAARYRRPVVYPLREFAEIGGLVSYGHDLVDGYRQMGVYVGRILKGEKPADLPVVQPTKFEFVINLKTAKTLDRSSIAAYYRQRGDRMKRWTSVRGTFRKCGSRCVMSAYRGRPEVIGGGQNDAIDPFRKWYAWRGERASAIRTLWNPQRS
jgi:putative ABC transport system substrate-binding protein